MQRVALVCGYDGSGYFGLQRQSDASGKPTIEQDLERALVAAGAMRASHAGALHRVNWSRTSRTDKGVSAASNVVSLDVPDSAAAAAGVVGSGDGLTAMVTATNDALPPSVRVWGAVRADAGFDARKAACGRRYEYLLPVWALDPAVGKPRALLQQSQAPPSLRPSPPRHEQQPQQQEQEQPFSAQSAAASTSTRSVAAATVPAGAGSGASAERSRARAAAEVSESRFTLTPLELKRLNLILGVFVGSHCFHNFTSEPCDEPEQLRRTIHRAYAEGPVHLSPPAAAAPELLHARQQTLELNHCDQLQPQSDVQLRGDDPMSQPTEPQHQAPPSLDAAAPSSEPYVRIVFLGTGFLMHQIRRMVGLALAVARRTAPPDSIRTALDPGRRHLTVPTAPPTGLLMDRAYFLSDSYRSACQAQPPAKPQTQLGAEQRNATAGGNGMGGERERDGGAERVGPGLGCRRELERISDAGEAFKRAVLYPAIHGAGPVEMWLFLRGLTEAAFGFRTWSKRAAEPRATPPRASSAAQATHEPSRQPTAGATVTATATAAATVAATAAPEEGGSRDRPCERAGQEAGEARVGCYGTGCDGNAGELRAKGDAEVKTLEDGRPPKRRANGTPNAPS